MKLSVIILNYNVRYFLELCLQSVQQAVRPIDAEVIVVDNNSTDDSCQMVKSKFPEFQLIENKENSGFSKGNNMGVEQANGEYVCILNPDTVVPEDAFVKLLEFADAKTDLGILGCQLIDGTGNFLPESKRNIPTPHVSLKKMMGITGGYYNSINKNHSGKVDILVGAFMLLKRSVYKKVGGFDEDFFMYGEDIDLSYRILKKGFVNWYCGNVSVLHFKGESTLKDKVYAKRFYGAMRLFYKKHFYTNFIFKSIVLLGIRLASVFNSNKELEEKKPSKTIAITNQNIQSFKHKFPSLTQATTANKLEDDSAIIMDTELLSYSEIINTMLNNKDLKNSTFRIWPRKTNFIIGSDTAISRGEIIKF